MFALAIAALGVLLSGEIAVPRCTDPRLVVELFAAEPDIVTPTGITVDDKGNPLVIECHTHFPPPGYDGPKHDRIRRFEDTNGDGKADRISTFWEGSSKTMGIDRHPTNGWTYVATRDTVFRLKDADGDGAAELNEALVSLTSNDKYPHSGISGFAFDADGDVFFGFGENHAEPYRMEGADGAVLTGIEGGHVYRMKSDGTKLRRVSIGCWNPFHLTFDPAGRLFVVDNDPDSLPPCRLLHIVEGADYGYKYRNGRKGTHPYTAWNGELPGTLPMVAGTGEAPSGILACGMGDKLPGDYAGDLLVTSWGDHRIERYHLRPRGASVTAERIDVLKGDENFRPVGIAAGGDGAIYISDWVDKSYELHKKGRIWRLRTVKQDTTIGKPHLAPKSEDELLADRLRSNADPTTSAELWQACESDDPFLAQAARLGLSRIADVGELANLNTLSLKRRLAALLILRDRNSELTQSLLPKFLCDPDPDVRFAALQWVGEERLAAHRSAVEQTPSAGPMTQRLFSAWLATLEKLDRPPRKDSDEWTSENYLADVLTRGELPAEIQRWALRMLRPDHPVLTRDRLMAWIESSQPDMRLEAIRTLRESDLAERQTLLARLSEQASLDENLRAEAVAGLAPYTPADVQLLLGLAESASAAIAREALRSLRGAKLTEADRQRLETLRPRNAEFSELVDRVSGPAPADERPALGSTDAWLQLLEGPANAAAGERAFYHSKSGNCARCHQYEGRGGRVGPDLTMTGRTLDRRRLLQSILEPSREVAPQFVVWVVESDDGQVRSGVFLGTRPNGDEIFYPEKGGTFTIPPAQIVNKVASRTSVMPEGLCSQLSVQELRDLLAFLQQKR